MNGCNLAVLITAIFAAIAGLAYFAVGIWTVADDTTILYFGNFIYYNNHNQHSLTLQVAFIVVPFGFLPLFTMGFAVASVSQDKRNLLLVFIVFNVIFLMFQIPLTVASLAMLPSELTRLKSAMTTSLNNYVGIPFSYNMNLNESLLWDKLMLRKKCCGIDGPSDFTLYAGTKAKTWSGGYRSHLLSNGNITTMTLAAACCEFQDSAYTKMVENKDWGNYRNYLKDEYCPITAATTVVGKGCYTILENFLLAFIPGVIGSFYCIIILEVIGLICAAFRYRYWNGYESGSSKVQAVPGGYAGAQPLYGAQLPPPVPLPPSAAGPPQQAWGSPPGYDANYYGGGWEPQSQKNTHQYGRSFGGGWGTDSYQKA